MIGGFALVAYPAKWDNSGVMTFIVNHDGVVFQKRQMINIEQLRFPSGIAAAETLRALHSHGGRGFRRQGPGDRRCSGRGQPVLG